MEIADHYEKYKLFRINFLDKYWFNTTLMAIAWADPLVFPGDSSLGRKTQKAW